MSLFREISFWLYADSSSKYGKFLYWSLFCPMQYMSSINLHFIKWNEEQENIFLPRYNIPSIYNIFPYLLLSRTMLIHLLQALISALKPYCWHNQGLPKVWTSASICSCFSLRWMKLNFFNIKFKSENLLFLLKLCDNTTTKLL